MGRPILRFLGWLMGVGIFVYLMFKVDLKTLMLSISQTSLMTAAWLVSCNILANMFQGVRFYFLWPGGKVGIWKQMALPFLTHAANILLPFRVGEAVKPLTLKKWSPTHTLKSLFYWTVIDKFLEIVSFTGFVVWAAFAWNQYEAVSVLVFIGAHIALYFSLRKSRPSRRNIALAYIASLGNWAANGAFFYILLQPLRAALGLFVGTSLASSLPLAPAGLGTYEAAFVWICQRAGLDTTQAMARALSAHSLSILSTLLIGAPLGAVWGWAQAGKDEVGPKPGAPLRYMFSNAFVWFAGALVVLCSGALWIPSKRMPKGRTVFLSEEEKAAE